jgi:ribosomal protein S18 acetylase RimI-like enzyme
VDVSLRALRGDDFACIVEIDARVRGGPRPQYYERRMRSVMDPGTQIVSSLVAELDGRVVGFLIGQVCDGEFGMRDTTAVVDTIGVDPAHQRKGIGRMLLEEFLANMRAIGVGSMRTIVDWKDWDLVRFFGSMGFEPAAVLNLERRI